MVPALCGVLPKVVMYNLQCYTSSADTILSCEDTPVWAAIAGVSYQQGIISSSLPAEIFPINFLILLIIWDFQYGDCVLFRPYL